MDGALTFMHVNDNIISVTVLTCITEHHRPSCLIYICKPNWKNKIKSMAAIGDRTILKGIIMTSITSPKVYYSIHKKIIGVINCHTSVGMHTSQVS